MTTQNINYFPMSYSYELHNAILANDMPRIEKALENVRELNCLYYNSKSTPLRHAILQCNPTIVELLLKRGASPNHRLEDGLTAFHYAVRTYGASIRMHNLTMKLRVLLHLLRNGADPDTTDSKGVSARKDLESAQYTIDRMYLVEHCSDPKAFEQPARPGTPLQESLEGGLYM